MSNMARPEGPYRPTQAEIRSLLDSLRPLAYSTPAAGAGPVCVDCQNGYHESILQPGTRCTCACHGGLHPVDQSELDEEDTHL